PTLTSPEWLTPRAPTGTVVLQRAFEHVASPGPYRVKVTLPVGAKPPARVAESEIRPPAGTDGDARVEIVGVAAARMTTNPPTVGEGCPPTAMQRSAPHATSHR